MEASADTEAETITEAETDTEAPAVTEAETHAAAETHDEGETHSATEATSEAETHSATESDGETHAAAEPEPQAQTETGPRAVSAEENEATRARMMAHALEQRRLNDARWSAAEATWHEEARDEAWADGRERELLAAMRAGDTDAIRTGLECRRTLCRVELRVPNSHSFLDPDRSRAFIDALGRDIATQMQGPAAERRMVLFSARDGHGLQPALPALQP